jgi:MFS family permease
MSSGLPGYRARASKGIDDGSFQSWYSVGVLTIAYTLSYIDRQALFLMVGPIRRDLGISDTEFSLMGGLAFAVFYTLMGIPIAWFADRTHRARLIAVAIAFWSLATAMCGMARSFGQLFLARVGVGVGEAALSPAAFSMISDLFPKQRLGRAIGIYSSGVFVGVGLSFIVGGVLIDFLELRGGLHAPLLGHLTSWQAAFLIISAPGLLIAALMLTVGEPLRTPGPFHADRPLRFAHTITYFRENLATFLLHFLGFAMLAIVFYSVISWAPEYFIRIHGISRTQIGTILGISAAVFGGAGIICGGLLSDYLSSRGYTDAPILSAATSAAVLLPLSIAAPLVSDPHVSMMLFCPLLFFASLPFGPAAVALQTATPPRMRAQISSFYLFFANLIGIGMGGTATAMVTDFVYASDLSLHYSLATVGAVGSTLALILLLLCLGPFRETLLRLEQAQPGVASQVEKNFQQKELPGRARREHPP